MKEDLSFTTKLPLLFILINRATHFVPRWGAKGVARVSRRCSPCTFTTIDIYIYIYIIYLNIQVPPPRPLRVPALRKQCKHRLRVNRVCLSVLSLILAETFINSTLLAEHLARLSQRFGPSSGRSSPRSQSRAKFPLRHAIPSPRLPEKAHGVGDQSPSDLISKPSKSHNPRLGREILTTSTCDEQRALETCPEALGVVTFAERAAEGRPSTLSRCGGRPMWHLVNGRTAIGVSFQKAGLKARPFTNAGGRSTRRMFFCRISGVDSRVPKSKSARKAPTKSPNKHPLLTRGQG